MKKVLFVLAVAACMVACSKKAENKACCEEQNARCEEQSACCKAVAEEAEEVVVVEEMPVEDTVEVAEVEVAE